jgi:hypothetical protein
MDRDERDDAMLEARLSGTSVLAISRQHRCSTTEVEAVIDQRLAGELDNQARLKAIKLDVARLEALMAPFFERATKDRDVAAGTLCVKILERRALLLGLDQPIQSRLDVYQVSAQEQPNSFERLHDLILRISRRKGNGADGDQPPGDGTDGHVTGIE